MRKLPQPHARRHARMELAAQLFHQCEQLSARRGVPPRRDRREHQDDRTDLSDRLARGLLHQEQTAEQHRRGEGELRTDHLRPHLQGHLDRGAGQTHQPVADLVQEGVPPPLPDASPQVVHPPAADALASAADLDIEIRLGDRQRVHLPQYVAFHQALQEGVPDDTRHVPPTKKKKKKILTLH